jgi:hypothetical protein
MVRRPAVQLDQPLVMSALYPTAAAPAASSSAIADAIVDGNVEIEETLAFTTSTVDELTNVIREVLALTDPVFPVAYMTALVTEMLSLQGTAQPVLEATVAEILGFADVADGAYLAYAAIVDSLVLSGAAENTVAAMAIITEVLALRDALVSVQDGQVNEAFALMDAIETRISWYEALVSSAVFADENIGQASVTVLLNDSFVFDETIDARASFLAAIQEELDFSVGFVFDDTPYVAYSMTAATKALSSYTNFAFDSMASFNGKVYAAGEGGLYRLGGDTDAGVAIPWRIRTGLSNLGTGRQKGMDAAYLGYTATGRIILKCIVVAPTGEKKAYLYEMAPSGGSAKPGRILTGRGLRSVYWGFELTNIDAGDIELDTLELHPVVFEGRVP